MICALDADSRLVFMASSVARTSSKGRLARRVDSTVRNVVRKSGPGVSIACM